MRAAIIILQQIRKMTKDGIANKDILLSFIFSLLVFHKFLEKKQVLYKANGFWHL